MLQLTFNPRLTLTAFPTTRPSFVTFLVKWFVYTVCPAVLSCSNLKLHQTLEVKNILKQEKIML